MKVLMLNSLTQTFAVDYGLSLLRRQAPVALNLYPTVIAFPNTYPLDSDLCGG